MRFWLALDAVLIRQAAGQADKLRDAVAKTVEVEPLIEAFRMAFPMDSKATPKEARDWAQLHAHTKNAAGVEAALNMIYAIGYQLGDEAALAAYSHAAMSVRNKAPLPNPPSPDAQQASINTDWATWTAGGHPAALLVRPKGGLGKLLRDSRIASSKLNETTLNRIGTKLADALSNGWTDLTLAKEIKGLLGDGQRALTIATTEMNRAMSVASMDSYKEYGVDKVEWLTADPCDECAENEDAGAIPTGDEFPTGDTEPPAHPNCRCSLAPVIDYGDVAALDAGDDEDMLEMAASADAIKGVPSELEVMRAKSRLKILPNPADPTLDDDMSAKLVQSPWAVVPMPTVNPNAWDNAKLEIVELDELLATDPFLSRKKVKQRIESMGAAQSPYRNYALVLAAGGSKVIIDGHHRLMAQWLLGQEQAAVWISEE